MFARRAATKENDNVLSSSKSWEDVLKTQQQVEKASAEGWIA